MKSKEDIEKLLEDLGSRWPSDDSITNRVMQTIESAQVQSKSGTRLFLSKRKYFSIMNNHMLSRIAAIVVGSAALITIIVLLVSGGQGQIAFAQIMENVRQTRSLVFKHKSELENTPTQYESKGFVLPDGKIRTENPSFDMIMDAKSCKAMFIDKQNKTAKILEDFDLSGKVDVYEMFRNIIKDAVERLPDEEIDGRSTMVFRVELPGPSKDKKMPMKVWVDPKNDLPFRMEHSSQEMNGKKIKILIYDIVFDQPLDPALFSFDPPKGYKVIEQSREGEKEYTGKNKVLAVTAPEIRVRVVGPDDKPIAGAKIQTSIWSEDPQKRNRDFVCDANGQTIVDLPKSIEILRLWARMEGYVPMFAHWEQYDTEPIPAEFTFKLSKGTTIGGFVKNEDGQPIEGARIGVSCYIPGEMTERMYVDHWLAEGESSRFTDTRGRWTLNNVPEGNDIKISINVNHPDYISDITWSGMQKEQNVTLDSLRRQEGTIVMRHGVYVTGLVTDLDKKPISGAVVVWGDDPASETSNDQQYLHGVLTDSQGKYKLPPLPPGQMTMTVIAKGWAPDLKKITITPENPKIDFQLQPGKTLRIRFVDNSGKPISGVGVMIEGWRGCKSLYNCNSPILLDTKIPGIADKNGVYEWTWAPHDAVSFSFWKEGYRQEQPKSLKPDGSEQEIRLSM
jgi:outer membrane lipoprotein-sorting protein